MKNCVVSGICIKDSPNQHCSKYCFTDGTNYGTIFRGAFVRSYQKTAPRYAELLDYVQQGGALGSLT